MGARGERDAREMARLAARVVGVAEREVREHEGALGEELLQSIAEHGGEVRVEVGLSGQAGDELRRLRLDCWQKRGVFRRG